MSGATLESMLVADGELTPEALSRFEPGRIAPCLFEPQ